MSAVGQAERVLCELIAKRDGLVSRGNALADERRQIAFAAHTGDHEARKRLDTINRETSEHVSELESLVAAISEATDRLEEARCAEAAEADQANARELRRVLEGFVEHGRKIDAALAAFVNESTAFRESLTKIHSLGCDFPSHGLADTNARLAIGTALMQTPWRRDFEHLAPGRRRTFCELVAGWAVRIEPTVRRRLGETEPKDEAV